MSVQRDKCTSFGAFSVGVLAVGGVVTTVSGDCGSHWRGGATDVAGVTEGDAGAVVAMTAAASRLQTVDLRKSSMYICEYIFNA